MPAASDHSRRAKLRVQGLFKYFPQQSGQLLVLDNIDLHVEANEFVTIVGASGCGKSTLLHIIAGLMPASAGAVLMNGEVIEDPGPDRGMVFQSYTLFPWLTVAENISFGLHLQRLPKAEIQERMFHYLAVVGLTKFAKAYPKQLSGGMQQRVAIARALATDPEVLLMDEPFGALDAQTREQMQQFFLTLWHQTPITVLMITHDVEEAIFLSQRVYVMSSHPGQIQDEVYVNLPPDRPLDAKMSQPFLKTKRQILHALHRTHGN